MQHALAVVRQNHGLVLGNQSGVALLHGFQAAFIGRFFKIQTDKLLIARQNAQFERGIGKFAADKVVGDIVLRQQIGERVGGFIFAHHRQQRSLPAQHGDIARHIRRAARAMLGLPNLGNRHGGFGRDARHITKPILV